MCLVEQPNISEINFLPPAFELLPRFLLLLDDPEANCEELVRLIRVDPGLTANVLRIANSARYAGTWRTQTLQDSVTRLGLREIYRITMKVVVSPVLGNSHDPVLARLNLWAHSLAVGVAAGVLARMTGQDEEVAFTTGLLHDIGKLVLARERGQEYVAGVEKCKVEHQPFWRREREWFGTDHAKAGAEVLREWNFPEKIVEPIKWHHEPGLGSSIDERMTATTTVANTLAYRLGHGYGCPAATAEVDSSLVERAGVARSDLERLEGEVSEALKREYQSVIWQ